MVIQGPLIGREPELAELEATLNGTRLLTVIGAGGCGKTRLALELTERVARTEGGRLIASLSSVTSEEQLLDALLAALGARERFGSTPRQVLIERIASRRALLVLDNCEHLLAPVGRLAAELLNAAPGVRVLATSREPLAVPQERVFRLGPLSLPDGEDVGAVVRSDAARLFVDRAVRSDPTFVLARSSARAIAEICRELDGLPLALVLAAARLDTLTVDQIAQDLSQHGRLSTVSGPQESSQHRSLRASLDWSYRLLDERQQQLLRRLSVFSAGFTTSAAGAVAGTVAAGESVQEIGELLEALEVKGLLARTSHTERWGLPQTVGEYATEQLTRAGERDEVADRHLLFFRAYAARADRLLLEAGGHTLIDRDRANLRVALRRAVQVDRAGALEITAGLMRHWVLAEHFREVRSVCATILSGANNSDNKSARAIVHCGAALAELLGETYEGAIAHTRSGLALAADAPDPGVEATCLQFSAMVLIQTATDPAQGLHNAERAVDLARGAGDRLGLALALVNFAVSLMLCERFDAIGRVYGEFLEIPQACEHPRLRTWAEQTVAWAQVSAGSPKRALEHADLALSLEGDWPSMTHFQVLSFRIHALARMGHTEQAIAQGADALRAAHESGAPQAVPAIELALMVAHFMHGDLDSAATWARSLLRMPQSHTLALAHETLGRVALMRNEIGEARTQADHLETLAERSGGVRQRALARYVRGRAALQAGETGHARELLHAALMTYAELGLERDAADVLDALALDHARARAAGGCPPASLATEDMERAARLAAAASAARERLGCAPGPDVQPLGRTGRRLRASAESERWEAAWAQGQALSIAEAVAYVRRGRGARVRPASGWGSLTPTELDVAKLAASGLSNPRIAERLFISRSTVKMHLANTYRKLQIANRTELATILAASSTTERNPRANQS